MGTQEATQRNEATKASVDESASRGSSTFNLLTGTSLRAHSMIGNLQTASKTQPNILQEHARPQTTTMPLYYEEEPLKEE